MNLWHVLNENATVEYVVFLCTYKLYSLDIDVTYIQLETARRCPKS